MTIRLHLKMCPNLCSFLFENLREWLWTLKNIHMLKERNYVFKKIIKKEIIIWYQEAIQKVAPHLKLYETVSALGKHFKVLLWTLKSILTCLWSLLFSK